VNLITGNEYSGEYIETVSESGQGAPGERCNRAKINGRGNNRKKINRPVIAIDADAASVSQQKRGKKNFNEHTINSAAGRQPGNEAAFKNLKDPDRQQRGLLMNFGNWWKHGKAEEKKQSEKVDPAEFAPGRGLRLLKHVRRSLALNVACFAGASFAANTREWLK